eukprot:scaffold795_cov195-Alexandrium_tamarense.AAC.7
MSSSMNNPCVGYEWACTDADVSSVPTRKFTKYITDEDGNRDRKEAIILLDDGTKTVDFSQRVTVRDVEYATTELDWSDKECYKHFPSVLKGYASTAWEEVLEEEDQAKAGSFKNITTPRFYKKLGGDDRKQGATILYFLEHKWKKPMAKTPQQHYHRMVELLQILEKLNKSQPTPNKEKKKLLFFHAMPLDWQTAYKGMGQSLDNEDLLGRILPFMASMHDKELKLQAAKKNINFQVNNKRNEQDKKRPATQQSNPNKRATADSQKYGGTKQCLKHPQHKHTWNECFENPKGPNYKPKANSTASKTPSKKSTDSGDAKVINEMSSSPSLFSNH